MNPIFVLGDNHGVFHHIVRTVKRFRPAAIISVGDLTGDSPESLDDALREIVDLTEFWWIPGNHDTDSVAAYAATFGSTLANRNLHGRTALIGGYRMAGLGGVFRGEIWLPPASPNYPSADAYVRALPRTQRWQGWLPCRHRSTIFPDTVTELARQRADILVTHEAPSCHPHGFMTLDNLAQGLGVRAAFHGHHHDALDYSAAWDALGFRAYGVGLCGITTLDGEIILPGVQSRTGKYRRGRV